MPAQADSSNDQIEGSFRVTVENGIDFDMVFTGDVEKITLSASGKTYTQAQIHSISSSNPEVMGAIKYAIKDKISTQLQQSFPKAEITSETELPSYKDQLFHDQYTITLTNGFFDLNQSINAQDFINGMLDVGAVVNYSFSLTASDGWNNSFTVVLPDNIGYKRTTGKVTGDEIFWEVLNGKGDQPSKNAEVALLYSSPTSPTKENETIHLLFEIDESPLQKTMFHSIFSAESFDISSFQMLPSFLTNAGVLPADAIRLCVMNNLTQWDEIHQKILNPLNQNMINHFKTSSFNQSLEMSFSWDNTTTSEADPPYNVTFMDDVPPIKGVFTDENIDMRICGISSKAVYGLVNAGANVTIASADVNIMSGFDRINQAYDGSLLLPDHVFLQNENKYSWNENETINGSFSSDAAPVYTHPRINTNVDIEIENTDLNLLSFFTGKTELTIGVHCRQSRYRNVTSLPEPFDLPQKVDIELLNADAFRLCVQEDVFSSADVSSFLNKEKNDFENLSKGIFPSLKGGAQVDENSFEQSLNWDGNISDMKGFEPVQVDSFMHSSYPLSFYFSFLPPSFNIERQNVTFSGIPDENVTYALLFPAGVSVVFNDSLNRAQMEKSNGKTVITISFNASEGNLIDVLSLSLYPSAVYVIGLFIPCIVSVIITLILFIVVYIIRKKRNQFRGNGPNRVPTEEDSYQDQEYYVPPPPQNRR